MEIFIVATPIGNLNDITLRALDTLKDSDIILAEDTRVTIKLLNKYNIKKKIINFNEFKEKKIIENFYNILGSYKKISLVSDAGTPLISDPGKELVKFAFKNNIPIIPVPGPSSLTTVLSVVPFDINNFLFLGFLEKNLKKRKQQLEDALTSGFSFVFFESPKRIMETLNILEKIDPNLKIFIGRELTKKFEELIYNSVSKIKANFEGKNIKGEFVVVVEAIEKNYEKINFMEDIEILKDLNLSTKTIATFISKKYNLKKNFIYNLIKKEEF